MLTNKIYVENYRNIMFGHKLDLATPWQFCKAQWLDAVSNNVRLFKFYNHFLNTINFHIKFNHHFIYEFKNY